MLGLEEIGQRFRLRALVESHLQSGRGRQVESGGERGQPSHVPPRHGGDGAGVHPAAEVCGQGNVADQLPRHRLLEPPQQLLGSLFHRHPLGQPHRRLRRRARLRGVAAEARARHHPIADREGVHPFAESRDGARNLVADHAHQTAEQRQRLPVDQMLGDGLRAAAAQIADEPPGAESQRIGAERKAADVIGFRAQVSLADGLKETVDWMRTNSPASNL